MEKSLTPEQRKEIEEKIKNLSYPHGFKESAEFKYYQENLYEIYSNEKSGTNKGWVELLKNNNHRMIRPYIENRSF